MPRKPRPIPDSERLRELFDYSPLKGQLIWRKAPSNRVKVGKPAGFVNKLGYTEIRLDGELHLAHRLIWKWFYGSDPANEVNHLHQEGLSPKRNHVHLLQDISPRNHRMLTAEMNKTSGLPLGVSKCHRYDAYKSAIWSPKGKKIHLGVFDTPEEAYAAYKGAFTLISLL